MQKKSETGYAPALDEHLRFESLLGKLSADLVNLPLQDIDSAITASMKALVEFFDADRCHLGTFSGDPAKIIVPYFYSRPGIDVPPITGVGDSFLSFVYESIKKDDLIAVSDVSEIPDHANEDRGLLKGMGIKSLLVLPLKIENVVRAGLSLSTVAQHRKWEEHTISHIKIVGNILANVMQRKLILQQIAKERNLTEAIMQGMPQLAYIYDIEGRLKRWNTNVVKVLGYTSEELQDKFVGDFIAEADRENVIAAVQAVFTDGQERQIEYDMLTKSGKKIPFYGSGVKAIIDGEPFLIGLTIDITELKEAQRSLQGHDSEAAISGRIQRAAAGAAVGRVSVLDTDFDAFGATVARQRSSARCRCLLSRSLGPSPAAAAGSDGNS